MSSTLAEYNAPERRDVSVQLIRHRFTVDAYHDMARARAFAEGDRVELIEGDIVDMTPVGLRHAAAVDLLTRWLVQGCGNRAVVRCSSRAIGRS